LKLLRQLAVLLLVARILPAQPPTPPEAPAPSPAAVAPPPATGTITGHVFLRDIQRPARMAYVALLPVDPGVKAGDANASASTQAGLDGSYAIPNVPPGDYYVVAEMLGYSSPVPVSYSDLENYQPASTELKGALAAMAAALTPITVAANRTTIADIALTKGSIISGSVHFDDGEPASQTLVKLLRKDKSGKWAKFGAEEGSFFTDGGVVTDDQGNFRLAGLPAGEYLLRTTLGIGGYSLDIYFGDCARQRDAKVIKLKDGEESNADNITIPLAKLHTVSGTVVSAETGAIVNSARVELDDSDGSMVAETNTDSDGNKFRFPYVAEGEYVLKVVHAADVTGADYICPVCVPRPPGEKLIRSYADGSQPLVVQGEMGGVSIAVKPQPAAAAQ
jgi:hypothetical protein